LLSGPATEKSWLGGNELPDFFEAKGVVESLFTKLDIEASFEEYSDQGLHPAKEAAVVVGDSRLGVVGEVHPEVLEKFEVTEAVYLFEIDLTALVPFVTGYKMFQPIPRFPAVVRDMALVVDVNITHQKIVDIIKSYALVGKVVLFDVYSGEQVPQGKKSLAYRVTYQSLSHTLTDEEVDKVQQQILDRLTKELGATLRSR
jgi:phenylalanyl-tRNA synthetase beta chain